MNKKHEIILEAFGFTVFIIGIVLLTVSLIVAMFKLFQTISPTVSFAILIGILIFSALWRLFYLILTESSKF